MNKMEEYVLRKLFLIPKPWYIWENIGTLPALNTQRKLPDCSVRMGLVGPKESFNFENRVLLTGFLKQGSTINQFLTKSFFFVFEVTDRKVFSFYFGFNVNLSLRSGMAHLRARDIFGMLKKIFSK